MSSKTPDCETTFYEIRDLHDVMTPALAIYPDLVQANIDSVIRILQGDANRWRPHLKTVKLANVMGMFIKRGVKQFKCATTLELLTACQAGAADVLVAHPMTGANAARVRQIAGEASAVEFSCLVENAEEVEEWRASRVSLFIDVNPGMDRTGIDQDDSDKITSLARSIQRAGVSFRGLHYYDGQLCDPEISKRCDDARRGYDRLFQIVGELRNAGIEVPEIVTSGTPSFLCAADFPKFTNESILHRVSPGTLTYCDATSLKQVPDSYGFRPAAIVITRVVSRPRPGFVTCDAGHKTLSVDMGTPNCRVLGHNRFRALRPSEEHLPIEIPSDELWPAIGEFLYLVPRHVCPTVNNFDHALVIRDRKIESVETVTARGREFPILR